MDQPSFSSNTNFPSLFPPLILPDLLAAIRPHFWPATLYLPIVDGCPICWWLPPPLGCSTGFIVTPLILGHTDLLHLCLYILVLAFKIGLSVLPPPAIIPTVALLHPFNVFLLPDGNLTLVLDPSDECPTTIP